MWYELYKYCDFLNKKIEKYPNEMSFTVEMDLDLYKFAKEVNFVSENGYMVFRGRVFGLG